MGFRRLTMSESHPPGSSSIAGSDVSTPSRTESMGCLLVVTQGDTALRITSFVGQAAGLSQPMTGQRPVLHKDRRYTRSASDLRSLHLQIPLLHLLEPRVVGEVELQRRDGDVAFRERG